MVAPMPYAASNHVHQKQRGRRTPRRQGLHAASPFLRQYNPLQYCSVCWCRLYVTAAGTLREKRTSDREDHGDRTRARLNR